MIGQIQAPQRNRFREKVRLSRQKILEMLRIKQKPALDKKIDEMLKPAKTKTKQQQIAIKHVGKFMGKYFGSKMGATKSIGKSLRGVFRKLL